MNNIYNLEIQAIQLGATHLRHSFIDVSYYVNTNRVEVFSTHFFNSEDKEISYLIDSCELFKLTGLTILTTPRVWSDVFKNNKLTGKPIDIKTRCVKQLH